MTNQDADDVCPICGSPALHIACVNWDCPTACVPFLGSLRDRPLAKWTHAELVAEVRRLRALPNVLKASERLIESITWARKVYELETLVDELRGPVEA